MPLVPKSIVQKVARRYIAGPHLLDAVRVTQHLQTLGASTTIDVLGEFVESRDRAEDETAMALQVVGAVHNHALDTYISVKLTSLGLDIDSEFAFQNLKRIVATASEYGLFVRMDMENTPYTTKTLDMYRRMRQDGFHNIGVVLQAYLRRTQDDIRSLATYQPSVRLCKGIYVEHESVAFRDPDEVRTNYKECLDMLLKGAGSVHIATHDEELLVHAEQSVATLQVPRDRYEFQMLLGVREDKRAQLIKRNHRMRVYVPFGEDWYGYSIRRLKENPKVAGYIAKAVLTGK
jgi:proline dehydrogenase